MTVNPHVILIQSCKHSLITDKYSERYPYPPIGLIYLSNILTMNGYVVNIVDLYLEPLSRVEFIERLRSLGRPILIGISSYTDSIHEAIKIASAAKDIFSDTPIVFGGPHVSFMYDSVMKECPSIDYCCLGEGEGVLVELLEHLRFSNPKLPAIKSLVYREEGEIVANQKRNYIDSLDVLPLPHFSKVMKTHMQTDGGLVFVSSRGCPGECIFCASRALSGPKYRSHSAEWIISLVYFYKRNLPLKIFGPLDDSFTVNRPRLRKFTAYLKQLNIRLPWSCKSRVDVIDQELVELLHSSNCMSVHIGVESGDDEVLKSIEKRITLDNVFNAIKLLSAKGIRAECSFILGHPTDTLESMERTLILATKLDQSGIALSVVGICTPFPGTKVWNKRNEYGLKIHSYNWRTYDLGTPIVTTDKFSQDDLRKAYFYFNYLNKTGQELPGLTACIHKDFLEYLNSFIMEIAASKEEREGA